MVDASVGQAPTYCIDRYGVGNGGGQIKEKKEGKGKQSQLSFGARNARVRREVTNAAKH
jgi:hypothetical protein